MKLRMLIMYAFVIGFAVIDDIIHLIDGIKWQAFL